MTTPIGEATVRIEADDRDLQATVAKDRFLLKSAFDKVQTVKVDTAQARYEMARLANTAFSIQRQLDKGTDASVRRAELGILRLVAAQERGAKRFGTSGGDSRRFGGFGFRGLPAAGVLALGGGGTLATGATAAGIPALAGIPAFLVPGLAAAAAAALALATPAIAGAAVAMASFAGFAKLAAPEFTKITTAVSTGGKAWKDLGPSEKVVGTALKSVQAGFAGISKALAPDAIGIFASGLHIIRDLMPAIRPLLLAAGKAAQDFADKLANWLTSPSGEKFVRWLQVTGPKDIAFMGKAFWLLAQGVGRTMDFIFNAGETGLHNLRDYTHRSAQFLDFLRESWVSTGHEIEHIWDEMWNTVIGRLIKADGTVLHWIGSMIGGLKASFKGDMIWLYNAGRDVIFGFWHGLQSVWGSVMRFIEGIPGWIRAHKGPLALDARLLVPAGKAIMGSLHLGLLAGAGGPLGFIGGLASTIGSLLAHGIGGLFGGGPGGGAPQANAALAQRMFPMWATGANWAAWNYVAMKESGWSQFARNPSSGAYGIPQALPFTKMPRAAWPSWAGGSSNPAAQIAWMAQYMAGVYGGPQGAAAHEAAFHWYDQGGWLPPGKTLAVNMTGSPELIVPRSNLRRASATAAEPVKVVMEVRAPHGSSEFEMFIVNLLRRSVQMRGGGDVQVTLGSP